MSSTNSILSLPFRRSNHISLSSTIRQYINAKYDQHPDMFRQDLEAIDALRRDAVNVREPHASGEKKLQAYAAQLVWIGGKFPIDIGAEFTWYPSLGYSTDRPLVQNNLKYELMNVLYNLAALYSQLAVNTPRGNTEGLKVAAYYFSNAAGVLKHLQDKILPELRMSDAPEDMDHDTLEALTQLMLAQSQECYWTKAAMDNYPDASVAKLAARVSDLYNQAGEASVKSDAISSAWIHHMTAKHHHFAAAAQYRAACDCLEKAAYGEEIARLKDALACVNEGLKEARGGYISKSVSEDLTRLKNKAEEDLKRAEKDNDGIYLKAVPSKSELKILSRANMAVARTPAQVANPYDSLGEGTEFGPALFSRLVPFSVHMAMSIYEERRDRMVNQNIIQQLEDLTDKIHTLLGSIGLPGSLQALEKPLGLPPSLAQHAEELRQADALGRIRKSFSDIEKLRTADMAVFEEGKAALHAEAEEDQRSRAKYGTDRWSRPDSHSDPDGAKLWTHAQEIEAYFNSSISSDSLVRNKYAEVEDLLAILSGSNRGLTEYVPSGQSREVADDLKPYVGRLRSAYNDVLRLESRRRKHVESLRDSARNDDIKPDILKEAARLERLYPTTVLVPAHFEDFFDKRLDRLYEPELESVEREAEEQAKALTQVERMNREFEAQKRKIGDRGNREREQALQKLDNAYFKYKEIVNNLDVGRKFYNDLSKIVGPGFRDVVRGWVSQRRMQARALEEELEMPSLSGLDISHGRGHAQPTPRNYQANPEEYFHAQPVPQQPYQIQQQQAPHAQQGYGQQPPGPQSPAAASIQSWAGGDTAAVQQPQPMQPPANPMNNMFDPSTGIRFGSGGQQGGQGQQQQGGRGAIWNPNSGIKFG